MILKVESPLSGSTDQIYCFSKDHIQHVQKLMIFTRFIYIFSIIFTQEILLMSYFLYNY